MLFFVFLVSAQIISLNFTFVSHELVCFCCSAKSLASRVQKLCYEQVCVRSVGVHSSHLPSSHTPVCGGLCPPEPPGVASPLTCEVVVVSDGGFASEGDHSP